MGKTVYGFWGMNESQRKCCKYASYAVTIITLGLWIYGKLQDWAIQWVLYGISLLSMITAASFDRTFQSITIDEEEGTITQGGKEKYPIQIAEISSILIKQSKKGRFRSLFIHDKGVRFLDIRLNQKECMKILEHLRKLNPSIEVSTANWL